MISESLKGKRVLITGGSGFIGSNLIDLLRVCGADVINADIASPLRACHLASWVECDVMAPVSLARVVAESNAHFVIHLAARTDTMSNAVQEYAVNFDGTMNLVRALGSSPATKRFVFVSTQFVVGPNALIDSEREYAPHTAYGESKAIAERQLRESPPRLTWSIVRPTNVWGPGHLRYRSEFWRVLRWGLYVHPASPDPVRSYGYVGSVCLQILAVMLARQEAVQQRALYVGDEPLLLSRWVDEFSIALRGRRARRVPGFAVAAIARTGDALKGLGLPAPLTSSRYRSMTQDYVTPMERTVAALGHMPSIPLSIGVAESVCWLESDASPDTREWLRYFEP